MSIKTQSRRYQSKSFLEEKRDIENTKRDYVEQLEDQYKPLIEAQKGINIKQNMIMSALVKQIMDNNQQAIGPAVEEPIIEEPIAEEPDEEETDEEEPDGKKLFTYDINEGIDPAVIEKIGYPPLEEIIKKNLEEIITVLDKVAEYRAHIGSKVSREQRINHLFINKASSFIRL